MAQTYTTYTVSSSSVLDYSFDFDVIDDSFVEVTKNGEELVNPTDFSVNATTKVVTLTTPPEVGDVLYIRRTTPRTEPVVEFVDAAREMAANLNKALLQPLHVIEEIGEAGGGALSLNEDGDYDAGGKKLVALGNPSDDTDAANKDYVDDLVTSALSYGGVSDPPLVYSFTSDGTTTQVFATPIPSIDFVLDSSSYIVMWENALTIGDIIMSPTDYTITESAGVSLNIEFTGAYVPGFGTRVVVVMLGKMKNYPGAASTAGAWTTARTLTLGNDLSGNVSIDGSSNVTLNATLATVGTVTPNTLYTNANIKVDAKGRVIELANGSGAVDMTGADGTNPGTHGLIPAPAATDNYKFFRGDGQYVPVNGTNGYKAFTASGTFTAPNGITKARVTVIGGGGGANEVGSTSPAGGAGAMATAVVTVIPGTAYSVSVGTGGANVFGGAAGTSSSFGALLIAGGGAAGSSSDSPDSTSITGTASADAYVPLHRPLVAATGSSTNAKTKRHYGDPGTVIASVNTPSGPGIVIVEW